MNQSTDKYIHINGDWALQSDQLCVTLFRKRIAGEKAKNAGQLQFDPIGYYANYEQALAALVDRDIQPLNHIDYMVERVSQLKKDIREWCKTMPETPQNPHSGEKAGERGKETNGL